MKYTVEGSFELPEPLSNDDREYTLANLLEVLPVTAHGELRISAEHDHIDIDKLSSDDVGSGVRLYTGTDHEVAGTLQGVFKGANGGYSVVVNNQAYIVPAFEVVEILPPTTEGQKDLDEAEEDETAFDPYADLSGGELEDAATTELVARLTEVDGDVSMIAGLLYKTQVETLTGTDVTHDEFRVLAGIIFEMVTESTSGWLGDAVRAKLPLVQAHVAQHTD